MTLLSDSTKEVLEEVEFERSAQDDKWGLQTHDNLAWFSILMEEVGEAAEHLTKHLTKGFVAPLPALTEQGMREQLIRQELLQVAAVAVAWIECIDRRGT